MRTIGILIGVAAAASVAAPSLATAEKQSPYAGFEAREIKALSPSEIKGLLAGEGLSASLPAELNGFPGPRHVLELAVELGLSDGQRESAVAIEARMKDEAVQRGAEIVALETELDRLFASGRVEAGEVERLAQEIGAKRGALRSVHLRAHMAMAKTLTADQRSRYMTLRGYAAHQPEQAPQHHHRH
jgi:hypothetical protein